MIMDWKYYNIFLVHVQKLLIPKLLIAKIFMKTIFFIFTTFFSILICLPSSSAQYATDTQINLPERAIARLGKGSIRDIAYSPDGSRLAVAGSVGIWVYDTGSVKH